MLIHQGVSLVNLAVYRNDFSGVIGKAIIAAISRTKKPLKRLAARLETQRQRARTFPSAFSKKGRIVFTQAENADRGQTGPATISANLNLPDHEAFGRRLEEAFRRKVL